MTPTHALIFWIAPLAFLAVALMAARYPGIRPRPLIAAAGAAGLLALGLAIAVAVAVAVGGPLTTPILGIDGYGLALRLDVLSAAMFLMVAVVGAVVIRFSGSYLDGDPRQGIFFGRLCLTLAAVSMLVLAGNLVQLVLAWTATSLALHSLLVFYKERPKARQAARKKFLFARTGDVCLVVAAVLIAGAFGTGDVAAILAGAEAASAEGMVPEGVAPAAVLLGVAALLKSAQFPAHGWLTEVMETPTPVSALLHAGIINAGGFLVIRFADVMILSAPALHMLALVGGFTALFGAVVMLTQTSVKVSIAWSTVSQMGFMLLQCGLGLFALAALHIVAHSLYKAHAFLSSGSAVETAKVQAVPAPTRPGVGHAALGLGLALALYAGIGWAFGYGAGTAPQVLAVGAILIMGVALMIAQAGAGGTRTPVLVRTLGAAGAATLAYFTLHWGAGQMLIGTVPPPPAPDGVGLMVIALAVTSFAAVTVLQIAGLPDTRSGSWQAIRLHLQNGLYVNAILDRLTGALARPAAPLEKGAAQ